jgi:lysophospholipase L1-like esterase
MGTTPLEAAFAAFRQRSPAFDATSHCPCLGPAQTAAGPRDPGGLHARREAAWGGLTTAARRPGEGRAAAAGLRARLAQGRLLLLASGWRTWRRLCALRLIAGSSMQTAGRQPPRTPEVAMRDQDHGAHRPADAPDGQAPRWRHLVVVGDSLGLGFGERVRGLELVGWADRVAMALRALWPGVRYTNLATNGLTTEGIARTQLASALALRPDLIIVVAGGNDLLARRWDAAAFRAAYTALLAPLVATGATVVTTTWHDVPAAVRMPAALAQRFSRRLAAAGAVVRAVSAEHGAVCVDFWRMPDLLDARCYSRDGKHPNARGYLRVARVMAEVLCHQAAAVIPAGALYTAAEQRVVALEPLAPPAQQLCRAQGAPVALAHRAGASPSQEVPA